MILTLGKFGLRRVLRLFFIVTALLLLSCSGGETGTGENKKVENDKKTSNTTTFIGPITSFGSIFVNGVEFDTSHARIEANGEEVDERALTQGMLVKIDGEVDSSGNKGVAYSVSYCSVLNGPVDQIVRDQQSGRVISLFLLGQTVVLDENTLFDSRLAGIKNAEMIEPGFLIEVSGFQGLHEILATHIEVIDSASGQFEPFLLTGPIVELTPDYFRINGLTIYYDATSVVTNISAGLHTGLIVSVVGHYVETADGIRFVADSVKGDQHSDIEQMLEMEGYIVEPFNQGLMRVNRFLVSLAPTLEIDSGDLTFLNQVGTKLQLRGHLTNTGIIEAHYIEIKHAATVKFVGNLRQVDINQNSFTVFGRRIFIDNHTIVKDDTSQKLKTIKLSDFMPGDRVSCDMQYDINSNLLLATKLQRDEPSTDQEKLKGPLISVVGKGSNIVVNIAGMELELSSSDNHLFFNRDAGTIVSVTGSYNSLEDVFEVSKVEFAM